MSCNIENQANVIWIVPQVGKEGISFLNLTKLAKTENSSSILQIHEVKNEDFYICASFKNEQLGFLNGFSISFGKIIV